MNRKHYFFQLALIASFLVNLTFSAHAGEEDLADPGQITFRSQISTMDFEEIDPYSGTLSLTHKDVFLPGNGGLDLNIYRTYRTDRSTDYTVLGSRWDTHFGRIKKSGNNHVTIELQDGTVNSAVKENYDSAFQTFYKYSTKDFWKVNMQGTPTLQLTDGTEIIFGRAAGSAPGDWHYATQIKRNNNTITISYVGTTHRVNYVTDSTGRRINFSYQIIGGGVYRLKAIRDSGNDDLVSYSYSGTGGTSVFESATYPDGDSWNYHYADFTMESGTISRKWIDNITTPYGGTVTYDYNSFRRAAVVLGYKFQLSVSEKNVTGSGLTAGTWTYNYGEDSGNNRDYTTIIDSCGRTTTYDFYGYSGGYDDNNSDNECYQYGLTRHKFTTNSSGQIEEAVEYTWDKLNSELSPIAYNVPDACNDTKTYVPVLLQQTVYRGGTVSVSYQITPNPDNWDVSFPKDIYTTRYRNFDSYGNSGKTTEYSNVPPYESYPALKTTTTAYWTNASRNIVKGIPSNIRTQGSGSFSGDFTSSYTYDTYANLLRETRFGVLTTHTYHSNRNLASIKDANNHTTTYGWNKGVVSAINNPVYSISRSINWDGTTATETNGRGHATSYLYTDGMRIRRITPPVGNPTNTTYSFGAGTYTQNTRGSFSSRTNYNGLGNLSGSWDSTGKTTTVAYKSCGLKNYITSNIGDTVNFDNYGRITKITHKGGDDINYTYHDDTHVEIVDEANKHSHQYYATFGTLGDKYLTSIKDANNQTATYSYNILGNLLRSSFGGNTRTYRYNAKNFLDRETHPESGTTNYTYDNVGNLKTRDDSLITKTYSYDIINRLRAITAGSDTISFDYDDADNLTDLNSSSASIDYTYDQSNRQTAATTTIQSVTKEISYRYDVNDNLTRITYPNSMAAEYSYNSKNQTTSVTGFGGDIHAITYEPSGSDLGLMSQYTRSNNQVVQFTYDSRRRMTRSIYPATDFGYGYDSRSNMATLTNHKDNGKNKSFLYDSLNRLTSFGGLWGSGSYQYNSSGNRKRKVVAGDTTTYSYINSRLTSQTDKNYVYNLDGDMTQSGDLNFDYDPFHQITQVRKNGNTLASYGYDGNKQRVFKNTADETTLYFYNSAGDVLSETRGDGTPLVEYIYLHGKLISKVSHNRPGDIYRDGEVTLTDTILGLQILSNNLTSHPVSISSDVNNDTKIGLAEVVYSLKVVANEEPSTANELFFYDVDSFGTPLTLSDVSGNVLWQVDELPFGEEYQQDGNPGLNKRRFIGKEKDIETGLLYFVARYMDASIGRFGSPDPVGLVDVATGKINTEILYDPQRQNRYAYGLNNPYRFIDPDGNWAEALFVEGPSIAIGVHSLINNIKHGNWGSATADAGGILVDSAAALIPGVPGGVGLGIKAARGADNAADALRLTNLKKGIPANQIGPSGKPKIHVQKHSTLKNAKDAARARAGSGGTTMKHATPTKGNGHFHGQKQGGTKIRTHDEYPK